MTLPRNLDEATRFLGDITPEQWSLFRLGLSTVLIVIVLVAVAVAVLVGLARRGDH